ncbi:cation diffusion facilitator family transporter [Agrobacterium sp. rho-8.1]|nr:cation diffusion facilitator family transporter [Agrobacterium sp. rho-8.1]
MSGHHHHHDHAGQGGDKRIAWAIFVNFLLTFAQIVGGVISGSLSLIADAIHNFSDAASLVIAFGARKIARRPADHRMTFGYARAEIVAALINYTTLIVIGVYLVYEAIMRFFQPEPVNGWIIVIIAGIALVIDLVTAMLTYAMSKDSMNIRAAFLHNVADALGSVGVIVAGTLILLYGWTWIDPAITLLIAGYILWQAFTEIGGSVRILMMGTPDGTDIEKIRQGVLAIPQVSDVHHVHVWALDEKRRALEMHVVITELTLEGAAKIRENIRGFLSLDHGIAHSTIEFETPFDHCKASDVKIGHAER